MNMICRYIGSPPVTETSIQKIIQSRKHSLLNNELTHANNCSWILIVVKNVWREMHEAWEDTAFVGLSLKTRTQISKTNKVLKCGLCSLLKVPSF